MKETLKDLTIRVRKEGMVKVETKGEALKLAKYALENEGYRFTLRPSVWGYIVRDEE